MEKYQIVKISKIQADENQPRKHFDSVKMHQLQESIKKEGIISPLIVEQVGDNFLILDGERRFRAAQEIGLKEVPVLVEPIGNKTARLTRQFVVQEQHENWDPSEKANALIALSDEIGISIYEVCKLLNIGEETTGRYVAFSQLVDRENWIRNEIPLDFTVGLRSLRNAVRRIYETNMQQEFTRNEEKKLERRVVQSVKDGALTKRGQLIRLKDAFVKNPKLIEKYFNDAKETPTSLYLQAEAQGATALRNLTIQAGYVYTHANTFLNHRDVKISPEQLAVYKRAVSQLNKIIDLAE